MSGWLRRNIIVAREERAFIAVISTKYRVLYIVLLYADNNDKKSVVIQLSTPFTGPKYTKRLHTYTHIIKLNHTNASLFGNNRQSVIQFESNCGANHKCSIWLCISTNHYLLNVSYHSVITDLFIQLVSS